MIRLNQVIAIEKSVKTGSYKGVTELHKRLQKVSLLSGISRTYRSKDDDGDQLPPESQHVQVRAPEAIRKAGELWTNLFDTVATKDWGNCDAKADVKVDGLLIIQGAPVTYLLFLEKQLTDIKTFVQKVPVLDPGERWHQDGASDCWATEPVETTRTKKVLRNHVKAEATEHHPAQVQTYQEDVIVGYWKTLKFSGALPASEVNAMLGRVEKFQKAIKFAREEANSKMVENKKVGQGVFAYLFEA